MTPAGEARLKLDEGLVLVGYPDPYSPLGLACRRLDLPLTRFREVPGWASLCGKPWTDGYGQTGGDIGPDTVITQPEAQAQLDTRIAAIEAALAQAEPWFTGLKPVWADVLVNIAYNVGVLALEHWPNTLACFQRDDAKGAAWALRHEGQWNRQVGQRAERLARAVERDSWDGVELADPPPVAALQPPPAAKPAVPPPVVAVQAQVAAPLVVDATPTPAQLQTLVLHAVTAAGTLATYFGLTAAPGLEAHLLTMAGPIAMLIAGWLAHHQTGGLSRALTALASLVPDSIAQVKAPGAAPDPGA